MSDWIGFLIGLVVGIGSGFFPGLHPNMLIAVMSKFGLDERTFAIAIISLYPANLISGFIPSIFFGIPDSRTVVSILPGQRMVLEGKGLDALKVVLLAAIVAAIFSTCLINFSIGFFSASYEAIRPHMRWIVLGISVVILARTKKPHLSACVFLVSGLLGKLSFESSLQDPFLPLFSGMFAIAAIMNYNKTSVPEQNENSIRPDFIIFAMIGSLLGMLADLIPGVGSPAQVAVFATILVPMNSLRYLATISSISVSQAIFSLSTSIAIDKTRIGAMAWLADSIDIGENLERLICFFMLGLSMAVLFVYFIRKRIAKFASVDFSKINIILALYLIAIVWIIDGVVGLEILALSSLLGWGTVRMGIERTNLMGSIIVPTLFLLFRIFW